MAIREYENQGIHDEHHHLREQLDSVGEMLAARRANRSKVNAILDELTEDVLHHFEHEESGGYFAEAIDIAPRLSERADELLNEHPQLAKQLAMLRQQAATREMSELWWRELHEQFSEFMKCFQRHEAAENSLLLDAYNNDIGAED